MCEQQRRWSVVRCLDSNWATSWENLSSGFATRLDSNQPAQLQIRDRDLTFWLFQVEVLYYPGSRNKGADQTARMRRLICVFVVAYDINRLSHDVARIIPLLANPKISRPYIASEAEQRGLSLTWSETPKTGFLVTWLISKFHHFFFRLYKLNYPYLIECVSNYFHSAVTSVCHLFAYEMILFCFTLL